MHKHSGRGPVGAGELLRLAWPFVLSNGCWTLQLAFNRLLLGRAGCDGIGAVTVGTMLYLTPVCLLANVSGYASIFVSQYVGAGQPIRRQWRASVATTAAHNADPPMCIGHINRRTRKLSIQMRSGLRNRHQGKLP